MQAGPFSKTPGKQARRLLLPAMIMQVPQRFYRLSLSFVLSKRTGVSNSREVQLWKSFLKGDNDSLEQIYRKYFDELYQYGNKWLNDPAFTKDIIQELFIKLMKNRRNLVSPTSIRFYLFRSFKNIALDKLKLKKKVIQIEEQDEGMFVVHFNPEHALLDKEKQIEVSEKLNRAIAQLTSRQREILYLRYNKNFSYAEVAQLMELTPKGTYKLMARAIEALKAALITLFIQLTTAQFF